ncbi:hypothetical protein FG379_003060 [Cryptosporidium bovis]|uniref:uncharacterized protein n=1 Tax=Cryptosporidium bovis TaxID=310047 RepID=UPI00351A7FCD|nr:hypothetical protein FG379_003060 [Cryptosporidium bovis]
MIKGVSALELFKHEVTSSNRIKTSSKKLDNILSGGVIIGKGILELCGVPGTGKTQLCKQLSLNIQIPKNIGGPGLNAIYIDTEGNFSTTRLKEISKSTINYIKSRDGDTNITTNDLLKNVKYIRIFDMEELINLMSTLPNICRDNNIGIIIIDSISMLIRICNLENQPYKLKMQQKIAKQLEDMSKKYTLSVIVTNHMTTRYFENRGDNSINNKKLSGVNLEPSLGLSWNSLICDRLLLRPKGEIDVGNDQSFSIFATNSNGDSAFFKDDVYKLIEELGDIVVDNKEQIYDSISDFIFNMTDSNNRIHNYNDEINDKLYKYGYEHEVLEEINKPEKVEIKEEFLGKEIDIGRMIINHIVLKQKEYNSHNICCFYRRYYKKELEDGKSLLDLRMELIEEFSDFIWKYQIKEEILFNTVNFMDNIIFREKRLFKKTTAERIKYLSYTCFYLAVKMERVVDMKSKEVCKKLQIDITKIIDLEKYIISQLSFRLNPVSPLLFLQHLMGILIESYLKEIVGSEISEIKKYCIQSQDINFEVGSTIRTDKIPKNMRMFQDNCPIRTNSSALIINTLNKKSGNGINKVLEYYIGCYILEICLYDIQTLKYSPLCQAISALLIAKECLGASIERYVKNYLYEYLNDESLIEDNVNKNINTIKSILKYPFIRRTSTTKKYLTNEYMNAANFVLRFICPSYR